jgi:hypothetical protein
MNKTENEYLESILREQTLAPDSQEMKDLQWHRENVRKILRATYGNVPVIREGGSKAKGTMIKDAYDLDMTCYFPRDDNTAAETLKEIYENVSKVLGKEYTVIPKGCAARLMDPEGKTYFHVDAVPGRFVDGDDGDVFLYPSAGDKERLKTNLDVHIAYVRDSGFVDAIRLIKLWRERNGMQVKTFVLELLTIKLLQDTKKKLDGQLLHVWEQLRDRAQDLSIEDPANPEGNDLSDCFSDAVKTQLSATAKRTLETIKQSGWEAVFGKLQMVNQERMEALKRISVASPRPVKPWFRGK